MSDRTTTSPTVSGVPALKGAPFVSSDRHHLYRSGIARSIYGWRSLLDIRQ